MAAKKPAAAAAAAPVETAPEVAPTASGQGRAVILTLKDGAEVRRVDYIKKRYYEEGASRSEIAKELTELQGKTVPYQIVFAATKVKRDEPATEESGEASSA